MEDSICKAIAIDCFDDMVMGSLYLGKKEEARKQILKNLFQDEIDEIEKRVRKAMQEDDIKHDNRN